MNYSNENLLRVVWWFWRDGLDEICKIPIELALNQSDWFVKDSKRLELWRAKSLQGRIIMST